MAKLIESIIKVAEAKGLPKPVELPQSTLSNKDILDMKTEHRIMKRIIQENGLWETLLNDKEFLEYLRKDYEGE